MKRLFLLLAVIFFFTGTSQSQIEQDFANVPNIHSLTNKCWQFYGTALVSPVNSSNKYLALTPPTVDGSSWIRTPYIHLTSSSKLSFTYQLSEALAIGANRTISVSLLGLDGQATKLQELTVDGTAGTRPFTFTVAAPANEVKRLFIEVKASGNESASLFIDNLKIDGTFDYNPPYACKEGDDGATSIHYLKNFKGQVSTSRLFLQWTVVENENNGHFEIERSADGRNFLPVASQKATARVAVEDYSHEEAFGGSAYYRLKLVSKAGIKMYSNVLFFKSNPAGQGLTLLQNPVQHTLKIGFNAERRTIALVSLYTLSGTKTFTRQIDVQKGYNTPSFALDGQIKQGIYLVEVVYDQVRLTAKVLKD